MNASAPIGIFDSGIGGLTVVRAVMDLLPHENIIYFGDTARVPYGIKSPETVKEYAEQITRFLVEKQVKMILIACNTVTAAAEKEVKQLAGSIPVLGVIEAGVKAVMTKPLPHHKVAVIGTLATVDSGAYQRLLEERIQAIEVVAKPCSLLVPLAEEGWTDNEMAKLTVHHYLDPLKAQHIDALILGCTHYPLFRKTIEEVLDSPDIAIIDSAASIAAMAKQVLEEQGGLNTDENGRFECFVSDKPQRFQTLAELFLGRRIETVNVVHVA
jgi:glutamate racemase